MTRVIQWKRGTTAQNDAYTGQEREITTDVEKGTVRVHDGSQQGGHELLRLADVPTKLSQLTNDIQAWRKSELTHLSQLINDIGLLTKADFSRLSQLQNDRGYKTSHCTHCKYCSYCQQCDNCHNCTTINCTTIDCTTIDCTRCTNCTYCDCDCDCGDDTE